MNDVQSYSPLKWGEKEGCPSDFTHPDKHPPKSRFKKGDFDIQNSTIELRF